MLMIRKKIRIKYFQFVIIIIGSFVFAQNKFIFLRFSGNLRKLIGSNAKSPKNKTILFLWSGYRCYS